MLSEYSANAAYRRSLDMLEDEDFWFVKKENAQDYMVIGKDMSAPARIVRRRVSQPEVVNE